MTTNKMIEELKTVRDALEYCNERLSDKGVFETITEKAIATLDRLIAEQDAAPDGYKLVPVDPTNEMIAAAYQRERCKYDRNKYGEMYFHIYRSMLSAAPTAQPVQYIPEGLRTLDWARDIAILKAEFKDEIATQRLDRLGKLIVYLSKGIKI